MDIYKPITQQLFRLWVYSNDLKRLEYLKKLEKTQYMSPDELAEYQMSKIKKIVEYAYHNIPFYSRRFQNAGLYPEDIKNFEDFRKIPLLSKKEIQENCENMISLKYKRDDLLQDMTGGSTGSPLIFYYTKERREYREAATMRHNHWAGWHIGDKVAPIWGAVRDKRKNLKSRLRTRVLFRSIFLDASSITEKNMHEFSIRLKRFKPEIILSYSNAMVLFTKFLEANKIYEIRPKSIVCTAEVLTEENRKFIENFFECKVYNRYGSREFAVIASECERQDGMHINAESLYVEFVPSNKANAHTEGRGEIVITDLLNFAMPLIRYRIMDIGSPLKRICQCGRGLPLMKMVEGRSTDFIVTPDGKFISGIAIATYVITNISGIGQIQIVQDSLNSIKVKLVKNSLYNDTTLKKLKEKIREFLGEQINVEVIFLKEIPSEPSGKYRFTISKIDRVMI